jgi:hypothetical protein
VKVEVRRQGEKERSKGVHGLDQTTVPPLCQLPKLKVKHPSVVQVCE